MRRGREHFVFLQLISLWRFLPPLLGSGEFWSINQLCLNDGENILRLYFLGVLRRIFESLQWCSAANHTESYTNTIYILCRQRQRGKALPYLYASATLTSSPLTTQLSITKSGCKERFINLCTNSTRARVSNARRHARRRVPLHCAPSSLLFSTD